MGTIITVFVLSIIVIGGAILCWSAGVTRRRSESSVATEAYRIRGRDSYTIEYRHCITTGVYHIFALAYPSCAGGQERGLTEGGQIWTTAEPRTLAEAKEIAQRWMESYSESLRGGGGSMADLSRPAMLRQPTSRQASISS